MVRYLIFSDVGETAGLLAAAIGIVVDSLAAFVGRMGCEAWVAEETVRGEEATLAGERPMRVWSVLAKGN